LPTKKLDQIIYYERYVFIQPGVKAEDDAKKLDFLTEDEYPGYSR
jgi:DNA-directed RNA polymerase subunit beta'